MRSNPLYYIPPSSISITPNANGSANDISVHIADGCKIKVFHPYIPDFEPVDVTWQEWSFKGRNRRLTENRPYAIYARLEKSNPSNGYLCFVPTNRYDWGIGEPYVFSPNIYRDEEFRTIDREGNIHVWPELWVGQLWWDDTGKSRTSYWWIKIGTVSEPSGGERTVELDTGILGTDQFNNGWLLKPEVLPLRVIIKNTLESNPPYIEWDDTVQLESSLVRGWDTDSSLHIHHWSITRNTLDADADDEWMAAGLEREEEEGVEPTGEEWDDIERRVNFRKTGKITLNHTKTGHDDFSGAVAAMFTITAWGLAEDDSSSSAGDSSYDYMDDSSDEGRFVALASESITILAETMERYEMELSSQMATYSPNTGLYSPKNGITVRLRQTALDGTVSYMTQQQIQIARLKLYWTAISNEGKKTELTFTDGEAHLPIRVFYNHTGKNLHLIQRPEETDSSSSDSSDDGLDGTEVDTATVAFVRNGETFKEKETIYFRSAVPIIFGSNPAISTSKVKPAPRVITQGEVNPAGVAGNETAYLNTIDGWVPEGWTNSPQGVTEDYPYEYAAWRRWIQGTDTGKEGEEMDELIPSGSSSSGSSSSGSSDSSDDSSDSSDDIGTGRIWTPFSSPKLSNKYGDPAVTYLINSSTTSVSIPAGVNSVELPETTLNFLKKVGTKEPVPFTGCDYIVYNKSILGTMTVLDYGTSATGELVLNPSGTENPVTLSPGHSIVIRIFNDAAGDDSSDDGNSDSSAGTLDTWLAEYEITTIKAGDNAVTYFITSTVKSITIPSGSTSANVPNITFKFYKKVGDATPEAFAGYFILSRRLPGGALWALRNGKAADGEVSVTSGAYALSTGTTLVIRMYPNNSYSLILAEYEVESLKVPDAATSYYINSSLANMPIPAGDTSVNLPAFDVSFMKKVGETSPALYTDCYYRIYKQNIQGTLSLQTSDTASSGQLSYSANAWTLSLGNSLIIRMFASSSDSDWLAEHVITTLTPGEKGDQGDPGNPGADGKILFPAGEWTAKSYSSTSATTPYVLKNDTNYYLNTSSASASDVPGTSSKWTAVSQMEIVFHNITVTGSLKLTNLPGESDWNTLQTGNVYVSNDGFLKVKLANSSTP